jgi:hypothetical protein
VYFVALFAIALVACGGVAPSSTSTVPAGTYRAVGTGAGLESLSALATRASFGGKPTYGKNALFDFIKTPEGQEILAGF